MVNQHTSSGAGEEQRRKRNLDITHHLHGGNRRPCADEEEEKGQRGEKEEKMVIKESDIQASLSYLSCADICLRRSANDWYRTMLTSEQL